MSVKVSLVYPHNLFLKGKPPPTRCPCKASPLIRNSAEATSQVLPASFGPSLATLVGQPYRLTLASGFGGCDNPANSAELEGTVVLTERSETCTPTKQARVFARLTPLRLSAHCISS